MAREASLIETQMVVNTDRPGRLSPSPTSRRDAGHWPRVAPRAPGVRRRGGLIFDLGRVAVVTPPGLPMKQSNHHLASDSHRPAASSRDSHGDLCYAAPDYTLFMSRKDHWETVYAGKSDCEVSWTQADPRISQLLIREICPCGRVIDIGGGTSALAERLLAARYGVCVLDISQAALDRAKWKLGDRASEIEWITADVTADPQLGNAEVWHDRAVFHFLTEPADRQRYVALLSRTIPVNGHAIIATFAEDGPEKCSGLPVCRYSGKRLAQELGAGFTLLKTVPETHLTPWGKPQSFQYSVFRRNSN